MLFNFLFIPANWNSYSKSDTALKPLRIIFDLYFVHKSVVRELKETIDVSSAFEGIVEDLSDRILSLEDDNAALRQSIYELEEATELATEMEEVQSEELKTLNKELESKDVKIINLEEAIKMWVSQFLFCPF